MFTVLADALFLATRTEQDPMQRHTKDWADRFVPEHRKQDGQTKYRFNPYRDLW